MHYTKNFTSFVSLDMKVAVFHILKKTSLFINKLF